MKHPSRFRGLLGALLLLQAASSPLAGAADLSPAVFPGESRGAAARLAEARKHVAEKKWPEAIADLQAVLDSMGDDLVPLTPRHSIQARWLCHLQLAALPPEALRLYRGRADPQARRWLEQGVGSHDVNLLRRIVDEAFVSRPAEKALDLLGDWTFERGSFEEAEAWWALLAPLSVDEHQGAETLQLVYPGLARDPARVRAKQLLARLFRGASHWQADLDAFRRRHPRAEGTLAGRKGPYADLLAQIAAERRQAGGLGEPDWDTYGGSPARGLVVPAPPHLLEDLGQLCRRGPTYRFNLETRRRLEEPLPPPDRGEPASVRARALAFYPVVAGQRVLATDGRHVTAYDLRTGESSDWYDAARYNGGINPNLSLPVSQDLCYTLTVADGCVFARLGAQGMHARQPAQLPRFGAPMREQPRDVESVLVCLSLEPGPAGDRRRWMVRAAERDHSVFEGSPVVHGRRVYIAATRFEGARAVTAIDCYPAHPEDSKPPLLWRTEVCEARETRPVAEQRDRQPADQRYRHHLLTLAGSQVVYCSHSGAVVAVDALTGRRTWAVRYTRRDDSDPDEPPVRGLAPCLFAGGRVYAAPADSDQLLCLDALTGRTLWERERLDVVDLLGVGQGRLIFSTRSGLRAVEAANGSDQGGWVLPDSGGALPPMGRGLLIGDLVLFSTDRLPWGVFAVRQCDGRQPDANDPSLLYRIPSGNLVYANGCLVVAGRRTLSVFVPPREEEARAGSDSRSEPATKGRWSARSASGGSDSRSESATFRRAGSDLDQGRPEAAARDAPPQPRLQALLQTAQARQKAGEPAQAVQVWQTVLGSKELRDIPVYDRAGLPAAAAARAAGAIAVLRARYGEKVYAPFERRAQELWAGAPEKERAAVAEKLALEFPNAAVTDTALLYLARQHEPCRELGNKGKSRLCLPLLRAWQVDLGRGERLLSGAEGANVPGWLWGSRGREDGQRGGELVARDGASGKERWACRLPFVPVWVGCHLGLVLAAGNEGVAGVRREDGQRVWDFPAPLVSRYPGGTDGLRVLAEGESPGPLGEFQLAAGRLLFLQGGRRLLALEAETGKALWQCWAPGAAFQQPVPWGRFFSRYHAGPGTVLVRTASGQRWLLAADRGTLISAAASPAEPWPEKPLALAGETLCVVQDARHVVLLDARTGRARWTHEAAGVGALSGEPLHILGAGSTLLVVTPTNLGYELQRLDLDTGKPCWRRVVRLNLPHFDPAAWALDSRAVYLARGPRLGAWSLNEGQPLWERRLDGAQEWRVARQGDMVLACPAWMPQVRFSFRWLFGSVQWKSSFPREAGERGTFPVVCCDPKTGRLVQRLNFLGNRGRLTAGVGPSRKMTVLPRVEAWRGLAPDPEPRMQVSGPLLVVAWAGQVWGLACPGAPGLSRRR